jgi:hypothetical protein
VLSPDVCGAILSAASQFWNGAGLKIHQHRFRINLLLSMEDFLRLYRDESFTFSPAPLRQSRGGFGVCCAFLNAVEHVPQFTRRLETNE